MYIKPCLQLQRSQSKWSWNGDKPGSVFLLPVSAAFALKRNIHLPCVARVNPMFFGFIHFNFFVSFDCCRVWLSVAWAQ